MAIESGFGARIARRLSLALLLGCALPQVVLAASGTSDAARTHATRAFWLDLKGAPAARSAAGAEPSVRPDRFRSLTLDIGSLAATAAAAPMEFSSAARQSPLVVSLPHPDGGFQRFAITESPVMEPELAAKHPEIRTYAGSGIDDPRASLRMDITPLGFHASVRGAKGQWYIDPYFHLDPSLYVSYHGRHLRNPHGAFVESLLDEPQLMLARGTYHAGDRVEVRGFGFAPGAQVEVTVRNAQQDALPRQVLTAVAGADGRIVASLLADPYRGTGSYTVAASDGRASATSTYRVVGDKVQTQALVGSQLRTYRLALLTDPGYATYFGGSANVTAAKATLINRVSQIYESETSIRLVLIANNDLLNLDTAAQFSGANGPCGGTACYPTASVSCGGSTLTRTRQVLGLLVGASAFDIGHIAVGAGGGGVASLGVVGGNFKAQGCTGLPTPVGDLFAVDFVAHEMGHQFAGNHTFNGVVGNCAGGNRNASASVEPGSGSSIMAYAGICAADDLQPHSDPYWSQRSFDEIVTYTSAAEASISEVQMGALTGYDGTDQFQLSYDGSLSAPIVRGTNFTAAGIKAAIEGIAGWPAGAIVTVSALNDTTFTLTYGGTLANVNVVNLQLVNCSGCSGYVGEIAKGGVTTRGGSVTATGNAAPTVSTPAAFTIPVQTPFALTASASDAAGDTVTYLWEQNNVGVGAGTALLSNTKTNGPLFRQFGTRAFVSSTDTLLYNSPGENAVTSDPTRTFPDLAQVLANNTNAETGTCPAASSPPTVAQIDCYSEFLPTPAYPGPLNFKVTVRDGRGGVNSASTVLTLAPAAGPFLVTSPNSAIRYDSGSTQTVTWNVANTNAAPVGTSQVQITLSTDGGSTFPYVLAAATPNDGSQSVVIPNVGSTQARIKVAAIGNVFFDVSNANLTIALLGDLNGDNAVNCADLEIVKASFGKRTGQPGFDPRADVVSDGVVNAKDLAYVSQRVPAGTTC